jgi:predicted DNA-binding transcriptional regulator YafY
LDSGLAATNYDGGVDCYLFAFDLKKQDMRTFVLTRLSNPGITAEQFTMRGSSTRTSICAGV